MPDTVALLAGYTRHNTGDWLLVKHGLDVIRERHPGAAIHAVVADPRSFGDLGADVEVHGAPVRYDHFRPGLGEYARDRLTGGRLHGVPGLRAIRRSDVAYTCGGGYLQARSARELGTISAVHVSQMEQAHAADVPLAMLPQSVGPFTGRLPEAWARRVLRWFPEILVREAVSAEYLRGWDPALRVRQLPDLVFWGAMSEVRTDRGARSARVGLVVRNWWFPGSSDPAAAEHRYLQAFARLAERLAAAGHVPVLIVHADGPTHRGDDRIASRRVQQLASVDIEEEDVVTTHDLREVEATYRACDVVVSTRMHGALIAIGQGVPTVCVGYEWKARGIFADLGLAEFVTPIEALDLSIAERLADDPSRWPAATISAAWFAHRERLRTGLGVSAPDPMAVTR